MNFISCGELERMITASKNSTSTVELPSEMNFYDRPLNQKYRQRITRSTESTAALISIKIKIMSLRNVYLFSGINRRVEIRSIQLRLGRKPDWCSRLHLSRVQDNRQGIMPVNNFHATLTKLSNLWSSTEDLIVIIIIRCNPQLMKLFRNPLPYPD